MAKPAQLWPGERMRTFFRSIFRAESGVDDELADRLAQICERHINRMLVWNDQPAPRETKAPQTKASKTKATKTKATKAKASKTKPTARKQRQPEPTNNEDEDISLTEAGAPWSTDHLEPEVEIHDAQTNDSSEQPVEPFDPFAFSAVVLLARSGADTLKAQLDEIASADNLRELANAQHLGVEASIRDADALRNAIVHGAKQRLADRRAAAS